MLTPVERRSDQVSVAEPVATGVETAAVEGLYDRNASRVFGYCLKMLGSREEAEDASQTTFMHAFRALRRGVVPVFETAWLLAIAKNVCRARHRASGRRSAVELARDPQDLERLAGAPDRDEAPLAGLQDALGRLPEMQRRAFLLREWQGRSYAEIALELDATVPAVEALIFRARRTLAQELGGEERRRGHAFDLASLLASLKSLLGGGAAVKLAAGAAAVVGVGVVAGAAPQPTDTPRPASERPIRAVEQGQAPVRRASAPAVAAAHRPVARDTTTSPSAGRSTKAPVAKTVAPVVSDPTGSPETPSPQPATRAPAEPPQAQPSTPGVPSAPEAPVLPGAPGVPVPEVPGVSLSEAPALPLAKVEVPELPPAPTDELPLDVPEVPGLPDPVLP